MNYKYIALSSLAFLPFSQLTHAQDTQTVKIQNSLSTALQQVDTDGEYLKLEKASDIMEQLATAGDKYFLDSMKEQGDIGAGFSFEKLLNITGISEITAGSKSIKKFGANYLTKSFIQTNGSRKGLLSLLGKADKEWASLQYAPAGTSLILETQVDLTSLPQIMQQLAPMMKDSDAAQMLQGLKEQEPVAGVTIEELIAQANIRISIIAELDKTKTWQAEGIELPAIHTTGRIDGIAKFLWENYSEVISKMLSIESKENVHTIVSPQVIESPWGPLTPVVVIDTDKDQVWFSLSPEYLATCMEGKTKLTDNNEFQLANQHQRKTGASRIFLSKQAVSVATELFKQGMAEEMGQNQDPMAEEFANAMASFFSSMGGISTCLSHDDKGMHIHTHAPFPIKEMSSSMMYIPALAGISYGPIMQQIETADRSEDISKLKRVSIGLIAYYAKNGREYPDDIQQLIETGEIEENHTELNNRTLHYVKGLDVSDGAKIILYTSADENGKLIIARVDGSVEAIFEDELEELLK